MDLDRVVPRMMQTKKLDLQAQQLVVLLGFDNRNE